MLSFVGKRLGVYELEEEIGRGAMGIVYRGRQVTLDRVVAVKVLLDNLAGDDSFVERFTREARILAALNHPNIIHIYDAGRSDNLLYFAMEYISGPTVTQLLKQRGKLPIHQAVDIAAQVASALDYAHVETQLVHRDVKPENMLLDRWGKVKVVDFGLARVAGSQNITRVGTVVGSLYYVPPEQLYSRKLDGRADVYSLGVALYEMLTGQRPYRGQSLAELSQAILSGPLAPPSSLEPAIPAELEAVLLRALERDRERRYPTAAEFEADLRQWAEAHPPGQPERKASLFKSPGGTGPLLYHPKPTEGTGPLPPLPAVYPAAPAKLRPDPTLPVITLPSIQQMPQPIEPSPTPSPVERPLRPARLTANLPPLPGEARDTGGKDGGSPAEEGPTTGDLLRNTASQFYQRFVSRRKKE